MEAIGGRWPGEAAVATTMRSSASKRPSVRGMGFSCPYECHVRRLIRYSNETGDASQLELCRTSSELATRCVPVGGGVWEAPSAGNTVGRFSDACSRPLLVTHAHHLLRAATAGPHRAHLFAVTWMESGTGRAGPRREAEQCPAARARWM